MLHLCLMKIAIDESGDTGKKLWHGSSKWFVLAAVIVPDTIRGCGAVCMCVAQYQRLHMNGAELHYSKNSHEQHLSFLQYMHDKDYVFAAVAVNKRWLLRHRPYVLRSKMALLHYSFDILFENLQPWLYNPTVLIDTNGGRHFNRALSRHLMGLFGSRHKGDIRALSQVVTVDSRQEPLVQLADYVAGAVRHHVDNSYEGTAYEMYLVDKGKIFFAK
ncbi:DUF3800 domain-containing protein [bacterium]|nr:DUF3800 domain-containing protein [bacterium]NBX97812.1 DUF3800 domain-containing protein [bacterium]NDC94534.1 DUF3800 domain-containing protein [bacterium]NDD83861.1 DUF3800 domain-containing protein [bacterium]NDG29930.1 DUF3800 domain-containing protein [bacterium]